MEMGNGYDGYSKSHNALAAEGAGRYPLSQAKRELAQALGITQREAEAVLLAVGTSEYHHTSSYYNTTDYYDVAGVLEQITEAGGYAAWLASDDGTEARAALAQLAEEKEPDIQIHENCHVEWLEWGGTRNHPVATERVAEGATVTVKASTATVTTADGKSSQKRLATRGFSFRAAAK